MSSNEALYSQLPLLTKTFIRLIRKEKQENALVKLQLSVHDIANPPAYTALSYTWGDPISHATAPLAISATIICNDRPFRIGKNLYDALCIMATGPDGYMWADAICVDQSNNIERNEQVAMMGSIYAQAQGTSIWLGMDDEISRTASKAMTQFVVAISKLWNEQGVATYNYGFRDQELWERFGIESWTDLEVNAIVHFFNRAWFERAWIVQEVALAKQILVVCGGSTLRWDILNILSQFLYLSGWSHEFSTLKANALGFRCVSPPGAVPMVLSKLRDSYAKGVLCERLSLEVTTFDNLKDSPDQMKIFYCALDVAISAFRPFKATNAQDKVYAPLALITHLFASCFALAPITPVPKVDYAETKEETFIRFTSAILQHSGNLSFLSHCETRTSGDYRRNPHKCLPSWVPDLSDFTSEPLTYSDNPKFHATQCWSQAPNCNIIVKDLFNATLRVTGHFFDYVRRIGPCHDDKALIESPTPWLEFCYDDMPESIYVDGSTHRAGAFARTIVCDQLRGESEVQFAALFKSYLMYACSASHDMNSIIQRTAIENGKELSMKEEEVTKKFFETYRSGIKGSWPILDAFEHTDPNPFVPTLTEVYTYMEAVINSPHHAKKDDSWRFHRHAHQLVERLHFSTSPGRRLITTRKGYIGLAPESVQIGDWIVFLPTSPVPFVIRGVGGKRLFVSDGLIGGGFEVEAVKNTEYELQGELYLHGTMYGEIFEGNPKLACEEILLV